MLSWPIQYAPRLAEPSREPPITPVLHYDICRRPSRAGRRRRYSDSLRYRQKHDLPYAVFRVPAGAWMALPSRGFRLHLHPYCVGSEEGCRDNDNEGARAVRQFGSVPRPPSPTHRPSGWLFFDGALCPARPSGQPRLDRKPALELGSSQLRYLLPSDNDIARRHAVDSIDAPNSPEYREQ